MVSTRNVTRKSAASLQVTHGAVDARPNRPIRSTKVAKVTQSSAVDGPDEGIKGENILVHDAGILQLLANNTKLVEDAKVIHRHVTDMDINLDCSFSDLFDRLNEIDSKVNDVKDATDYLMDRFDFFSEHWFDRMEARMVGLENKVAASSSAVTQQLKSMESILETIARSTNPLARKADMDLALIPVFNAIHKVRDIVLTPPM